MSFWFFENWFYPVTFWPVTTPPTVKVAAAQTIQFKSINGLEPVSDLIVPVTVFDPPLYIWRRFAVWKRDLRQYESRSEQSKTYHQ
jgi:hypothetical protein